MNAGLRTTSERISIAGEILDDITLVLTEDESHPPPELMKPPRASIASAICVALRVFVPRVSKLAVMSVTPGKLAGSTSPPLLTRSCAVASGICDLWTMITRKPFASVFSTGFGNSTERGTAGGGGVACGVCAKVQNANNISASVASAKFMRVLVFILLILLWRGLRPQPASCFGNRPQALTILEDNRKRNDSRR